jgi:hypothetical protein
MVLYNLNENDLKEYEAFRMKYFFERNNLTKLFDGLDILRFDKNVQEKM